MVTDNINETNMERYMIYCTIEQTKKALELGAPIEGDISTILNHLFDKKRGWLKIPTAEQMLGWLEEQKIFVHIAPCVDVCCSCHITSKGYNEYGYTSDINVCKTRKEATLAAIDAALEYLENNEKIKSKNSAV